MPSRYVHRAVLAILTCGVLIACGSSAAPNTPDVNGTWNLTMSDLTGPGVTCTATGTTMHLTTSRSAFSGTFSGGEYTCTDGCATTTFSVGSGNVVDGNVVRNLVVFDFGSPDNPFSGQVTTAAMSGTVTIHAQSTGGPITLTGNWSASRPTG